MSRICSWGTVRAILGLFGVTRVINLVIETGRIVICKRLSLNDQNCYYFLMRFLSSFAIE